VRSPESVEAIAQRRRRRCLEALENARPQPLAMCDDAVVLDSAGG
jgi:hypothetical protein